MRVVMQSEFLRSRPWLSGIGNAYLRDDERVIPRQRREPPRRPAEIPLFQCRRVALEGKPKWGESGTDTDTIRTPCSSLES